MSGRPRIAYLTPNAPYPFNRGGRIRAYHLWRAMGAFADVTPIIMGDSPPPRYRTMLRLASAAFYPRRLYRREHLVRSIESDGRLATPGLWEVLSATDLPTSFLARLGDVEALVRHFLNPARIERLLRRLREMRPDLVYLCDTTLGPLAAHVRTLGVPVVVGPHNLDSALYASIAASAPNEDLRQWNTQAARAFASAERLFAPHVDQLWVCSRDDADRFAAGLVPKEKIKLAPNVYDLGPPTPAPENSRDLVFVGQANYYPNEDAIRRLFEISRRLDEKSVPHRMRIVGRIGENIRSLAKSAPSVELVGEVQSVLPYIESAAVAPIALTLGGGTRLKILEALSRARPVISTPVGIEGIEVENGVNAVIEADLSLFPERIEALLRDRERAQRIGLAGWELARDRYSHQALLNHVGDALRDLGLNSRGPSGQSLSRNVGVRVVSTNATYNPVNRLFCWMLAIRIAVEFEDLSAEFTVDGAETPANAFVQLRRLRDGAVMLDATAVLPADIAPERMRILLRAWGVAVFVSPPAKDLKIESAGLMVLDGNLERIQVAGWSSSGKATVESVTAAAAGLSAGTGLHIVQTSLDMVDQKIEIVDSLGVGQVFTDIGHWLGPKPPTSARLRLLKDRHRGETAWLIGNGPSVRIEDLDRLEGRLTFCFNRFHLAHDKTRLRATYTLTGDLQMIEDFGQSIVDESGGTVFIANATAPDLLGDYIWLRQVPVFPPVFSRDPGYVVSPGGSTPFVAIQLAYYMGVRKFNFYGADFTFRFEASRPGGDAFRKASGEGNHFIANYRSGKPWCPPSLRDIGAAFLNARLLIEAEGGFIRNVTRGGALEIFERVDFERALEMSEPISQ